MAEARRAEPERVRVLIVDDEPLARRGLRRIVEGIDGYDVVGEGRNGQEAEAAIRELAPDVALLDIQMPAGTGLEVAARIPHGRRPGVVFVTAYDAHALAAFDAGAVDYVVKPVDPERLRLALRRAAKAKRAERDDTVPLADALHAGVAAPPGGHARRVVVRLAGRALVVPVEEIQWIEAAGSYVTLHTADGPALHRESMTALESTLDPAFFMRVHRSTIVALDEVRALKPADHGDATLVLRCGAIRPVSRRLRAELERRLAMK